MILRVLPWLSGVLLAFSVILGGGTHSGFLGDVIVQLVAAPLLAIALWLILEPGRVERETKQRLVLFGGTIFLLVLFQLLPLPFGEWTVGRLLARGSSEPNTLLSRVWAPVSVSPQATWAAAVSLLVPGAIFLAVIQCNMRQRLILTWLLLALGGISLLLAFLQMVGGENSQLRFYEVTNPEEAVGFFANRNHFAAQLYVSLLLSGIWLAIAASHLPRSQALQTPQALVFTAAAVFLVSIVAGLAMTRSRAGILLGMLALAGTLLLIRCHASRKKSNPTRGVGHGYIAVISVVFAMLFAAHFGFGSVLSRLGDDPFRDLRLTLASTTFELALKSLPFGTGLGTFIPVYATGEKTEDVSDVYANRAHNDLAEFLLETGVPGALLLLAFLISFCRQLYRVWFQQQTEESNRELLLQRAATLIISLLLAHSLVDYPLRTTAHGTIFAFFCAICATKSRPSERPIKPTTRVSQFLKSTSQNLPVEKWGSDMNWPESWRKL